MHGDLVEIELRKWPKQEAQRLKCLPGMWETWVRSLGQEDPVEKEMANQGPGIEFEPVALEGEVLTAGPPGKSAVL